MVETVQNEEAFEFFSEYCLAGDMSMETAGSLRDGKMVWGLAKVKESFDIGKAKGRFVLIICKPTRVWKVY